MIKTYKNDIVRLAGDTYPTKVRLKINGIPVDITDWTILLKYKDNNGVTKIVNCIISDATSGLILIYPHASNAGEELLTYPDFISHDMALKDPSLVANQVWDEDESSSIYPYHIVRVRAFDSAMKGSDNKYIEEQTHLTGRVVLLDRWAGGNE